MPPALPPSPLCHTATCARNLKYWPVVLYIYTSYTNLLFKKILLTNLNIFEQALPLIGKTEKDRIYRVIPRKGQPRTQKMKTCLW